MACRTQQLKIQLDEAQQKLQLCPCDMSLQLAEKECLARYTDILIAEELLAKDKAGIQWIKEGDRNTRFFYGTIKSHQARNRILTLVDSNGLRIEDYEDVEDHAVSFFNPCSQ
ncbi:hypothetical protein ACH5RR_039100 [Cinchona calisaya]|uniref:Uncharacterized protein n=1 Tax=Cinchona calisaya TaxID=153742 RepID=A0ABD2XX99_9GENT